MTTVRGHAISFRADPFLADDALIDDRIGSIEAGKEADLVVLDPKATPLLALRSARAESTEELMFVPSILGDDRAIAATYVDGRLAYRAAQAAQTAAQSPSPE